MISTESRTARFTELARPSGAFAMMAIDARKPMTEIFRAAGRDSSDAAVAEYKKAVVENLGGSASAVLCDIESGIRAAETARDLHPETGLIVAVDAFPAPDDADIPWTEVNDDVLARAATFGRVSALKLYVFWSPEGGEDIRRREVSKFIDACRDLGVLALVEGVSVLPGDDPAFNDSLVSAARELGALGPDIYKTQVPSLGAAPAEEITSWAHRISEVTPCPWVVLSKGVAADAFAAAVEASCRGGASGFLAGRAIWNGGVTAPDQQDWLANRHEYLDRLGAIVDAHGRPWTA